MTEITYSQLDINNLTDYRDVKALVDSDISEPYSIYVYRFFLSQWPNLCILVSKFFPFSSNRGSLSAISSIKCSILTMSCNYRLKQTARRWEQSLPNLNPTEMLDLEDILAWLW